ncbi:MAG: succinylglutamate desuccinylase/aspartoacylase family protein [Treponema sp.]|uniref:M14 family metallopeptidase n=1 Tax=Treponema sp. TaxID=166 RepID=UPI001B5E12F3|nr:M14 family metallopeptidase [Treponema sp.]MBP5401928.1 succinylglutamate desuccinylase/aspartoacylase family protein [Treponema sp.]MBR5932481.1 succinylglutamate desuccinylase/aspartoacylase family protein [Treponema sp.]
MQEITFCDMEGLYRDNFRLKGFIFGSGKKAVCIAGPTRGNEYQQQFITARIVKRLKELEAAGEINEGFEIMVIPSANPYSMNTKKKFWSIDSTDMNRMFPGRSDGVTTQIIAEKVFNISKQYECGIHLASYYMSGSFLPHVRILKSDFDYLKEASGFMMPYVLVREPRPYEKKTLNYTWQESGVKAFSVYSSTTDYIDRDSAHLVLRSILLFMKNRGIIKTEVLGGYQAEIIEEEKRLVPIRTPQAGLFVSKVKVGFEVKEGDLLAEIHDPYTDEIISEIIAPVSGVVFFMHSAPMTYSHTAVFKLII